MQIVKNLSNVGKEIVNQVQEVQRVSYRINPMRNTLGHILTKLTKIKFKEKVLNTEREKQQMTYKKIPLRLLADFQQKLCKPERVAERNRKLYRQAKAKRL